MPVWVQVDAFDPLTNTAVTLRAVNRDERDMCMAAGGTWWPMIAKAPFLRYDLFDGAFGGDITAPTTSFSLQVEAWPDFGRYAIADARVRVWTDIAASPIFDGRATGQPKLANGQAEISIKVDDSWLDTPLLATYAGTTGLEGPAGLKGQPKPLALGAPRYVPGKLIDSVNNVFQVSAYGAVQGFEAALERLARFGASAGDYSTYAALVAASIPAGTWATCKAQGLARFGAPTNGQVSFLLQGDNAGPDGWARKPGQLIRRLALLSGGAGKILDASLNALDAARPYNLSIYQDQQTTARQLIQSIAASVNAVAGVSWTGKLFVVPVGLGTATMTLAADGSALPPVRSLEQMEVAAPFAKIALTAERAWTVHALADIAFADPLVDMGVYNNGSYYRPGNIVQWAGASWRYQSGAAPGSGNPPPTPPTASNTWWTVLAQQGAAGAKGADSINNVNRLRNTLFERGTAGWRAPYIGGGITPEVGTPTAFVAYGVPIIKFQGTANAAGDTFSLGSAVGYFFPVVGGERLAVQVAVEGQNTYANAVVYWQDANGAEPWGNTQIQASQPNAPFGTVLRNLLPAPVGAVTGRLEVYFNSITSGFVGGAVMKPMVSSATATQAEFPPFTAGPADGRDGLDGQDGLPGAPGANGQPSYVHFAYADSADGSINFTTGAGGARAYIGVYSDFTAADSTNPAAYAWSLIKGADGENGTPGPPGANGQPSYVHIAYANSADGTVDFHLSDPTGRAYIGVYTDFTTADSTNPAAYTWSMIKGANGIDALSVSLAPSAIPVPCTAGGTPKAALPGAQFRVFKGTADVTGSTSYAVTAAANLSGVSVSGGGAVTVAGITGGTAVLTGYADITATKDGASQAVRLVYNKALDGAAYVDGRANVGAPTTTSYATVSSIDLLMGPNGTIDIDTSGGFDASGAGTRNVQGTIDYSLNGGSTWTTATSFSGNASVVGEPGDWAGTASLSGASIGLGGKQTVSVRVQMRKTNSGEFAGFAGSLYVAWKG